MENLVQIVITRDSTGNFKIAYMSPTTTIDTMKYISLSDIIDDLRAYASFLKCPQS